VRKLDFPVTSFAFPVGVLGAKRETGNRKWETKRRQQATAGHSIASICDMESGGKATPFWRTESNERDDRFSPDVRWIAYVSDELGRGVPLKTTFLFITLREGRANRSFCGSIEPASKSTLRER
jgi:hypothetical protein